VNFSSTFERAARAIETNKIRIVVTTHLPAGMGARYNFAPPNANTLETPPVIGREEEGIVLHEAVHAGWDVACRAIRIQDDEAAGYIAGAYYFIRTNLPLPRRNAPLYLLGTTIARQIRHSTAIATTDLDALRNAIGVHPFYGTGIRHYTGV
jgi:hypothetical protein